MSELAGKPSDWVQPRQYDPSYARLGVVAERGRLIEVRTPPLERGAWPRIEGSVSEQGEPDYRVMWEEAARHALAWKARYESLWDAIDDYQLAKPGRAGYAAARRDLLRVWLSVDDPDVGELQEGEET